MQVKTYTGASTQEVLAQIKAELGPDAVILSSRTFRKNGVRCHEMTAGLDRLPAENTEQAAMPKPAAQSRGSAQGSAQGKGGVSGGAQALAGIMQSLHGSGHNAGVQAAVQSAMQSAHLRGGPGYGMSGDSTPPGWSEWHKEWLQIKDHLFALMRPSIQLERLTPRQRVALEYLQREGVSDVVALDLYRRLLASPGASVLESLSELVPVRPWGAEWTGRVHCLTGPFGAGKTTAGLRMALSLRRQMPEARIAFINADCQRGNGRLVLRHWAELSDFTYMEAPDAASMEKALVAAAGADKVFIDMPGLSREGTLAQCRAGLGLNKTECATHLVLSPCFDHGQLAALLSRYHVGGEGSLIWTKLDEAVSFGALVNTAAACQLPVSCLSFGPGLKETLAPASEPLLWRLIFKRQMPDASGTASAADARRA